MKKVIIIIGLIIIVAGVGTPFVNGLVMERIVKQSFGDINQMSVDAGSDFSIEINQYNRNFSSSQIVWKIKSDALKSLYGVEEIVFVDHVDHGITGIVSTTSLEENKWFKAFVNKKLNGKNPLKIKTEYKLSGNIDSTISLDAFSFKDGSDVIEMMPGTLLIKFDKGLKNILSEMIWEGCSVSQKLRVDQLSFDSKIKKISTYIWEGNLAFKIKNIKVDDEKEQIDITNLMCGYALDYNKADSSLSVEMEYGIDNFKTRLDTINDAFARIRLNRIDAQGYENFMKTYSQLINDIMDDIAASRHDPDIIKKTIEKKMASIGLQMVGVYEKFLKQGFEIQISDVRAQLPQGKIKGDITLALKKDMTMTQFIPILIQPSAALDIFLLKSCVSLPYELAGDNQWLLTPVYPGMQTGLFIKDGDHLIHKAETSDGKLILNGKEMLLN
ncbi:MAG: hypothetical protein DRH93_07215 [Deltaproteobacteria bacterium]|nr:MAG: hypothetical protein DRH93_07215 [Deltaproteobacteria bacterium]